MNYKDFEIGYLAATGAEKEKMAKEFVENFPTTVAEAKANSSFKCGHFFDLVTEHEELADKAKFKALAEDITNLKGSDPEFFIPEAAGRLWVSYVWSPD